MEDCSNLKEELAPIKNLEVKLNEPLKKYTTFNVGGPAEIFLIPDNLVALKQTLKLLYDKEIPVFILGKGSNIVVSDSGINGAVVWINQLNNIKVKKDKLIAQTGATLKKLANEALTAGLSGLEFARGIPGSIGGALYMNAGAYGGEIKDIITKVECINYQGETTTLAKKDLNLDYRQSIFQDENLIAVEATFELTPAEKETIKNKMQELDKKRWNKQPMEMPSAGSMFKRPENHYAGALIDETGLKGMNVGEAQVSTKHAGFIVNQGGADAEDIRRLVEKVKQKVYEETGIELETEPKFIGEFDD
jgi:UDP-N-acetylmuramate dehydrogenase